MNKIDSTIEGGTEAELVYGDGEYHIVRQGNFVRCAVSAKPIPLDDLRYWSVELQEAYASPEISLARHLEVHPQS